MTYRSITAIYEQSQEKSEVKAGETAAASNETVAASMVKGAIYDTEMFSILVPDGWETKSFGIRYFARGSCRSNDYQK